MKKTSEQLMLTVGVSESSYQKGDIVLHHENTIGLFRKYNKHDRRKLEVYAFVDTMAGKSEKLSSTNWLSHNVVKITGSSEAYIRNRFQNNEPLRDELLKQLDRSLEYRFNHMKGV